MALLALIDETVLLHTRNVFWYSASELFLALLNTLAGLAAMSLFFFRRQEKEYLWYSLLTVVFAVTHAHSIWSESHVHGWPQDLLASNLLWQSSSLALMVFLYRLLGGKGNKFFWIAVGSVLINVLVALADFVPYMFREEWKWADIRLYNGLSFLLFLPFVAWVIVFVTRKAVEGLVDARLLLPVYRPGRPGQHAELWAGCRANHLRGRGKRKRVVELVLLNIRLAHPFFNPKRGRSLSSPQHASGSHSAFYSHASPRRSIRTRA